MTDLSQLQNLCKRDPEGYKEEFLLQKAHFDTQLKIFLLKPSSNYESFEKQIKFLSHVAPIYKAELKTFPNDLCQLLEERSDQMEPHLRKSIVNCLIMLRNRNLIAPTEFVQHSLYNC
jgi:protein SDA1